jgi:lipopolysaccharide export system protein LptA
MTMGTMMGKAFFAALICVLGATAGAAQPATLFPGLGGDPSTPIEVEADKLEVSETETERIAVFEGNVSVRRGETTIRAGRLALHSDLGGDVADLAAADEAIRRIEATGGVSVISGDQNATGNSASYDLHSQTITLAGDVRLAQGDSVISGERLVIDLARGTARVEESGNNRIRATFVPDMAP